jgi:hypothetical protein
MDILYSDGGHTGKWPFHRQPSRRQSSRRHFRNGRRAAVLRALTAARLYSSGSIPSLANAAEACGSNHIYVKAATVLLKAENETLLQHVLVGDEGLLAAARQARRTANLISAYRSASHADRVVFARTCGAEAIFDVLAEAAS